MERAVPYHAFLGQWFVEFKKYGSTLKTDLKTGFARFYVHCLSTMPYHMYSVHKEKKIFFMSGFKPIAGSDWALSRSYIITSNKIPAKFKY